MKKIAFTIMMFAGLFASCTTEDLTIDENTNNYAPLSEPGAVVCTDAAALGGEATLSSYTGQQITFTWNDDVAFDAAMTYESYIEIAEDAACPAPAGAAAVPATHPIDVFNTTSLVLPQGVSAKCFNWRIVINGYNGSQLQCTSTTEWMPATYVQQ